MKVMTKNDIDRKLMMKIIGGFGGGVYTVTKEMALQRHFCRMILLVRWTFLIYCEKNRCSELSLAGFGHGLERSTIGMWMDSPYMKMYNDKGHDVILAQLSVDTMKELYKYIKGLNK